MKTFKIKVFSFILIISFFIGVPSVIAQVEYWGEFCWQVNVTTSKLDPLLVKVGATHMGDYHFLLSGKITSLSSAEVIGSLHGNADVDGGNVVMTLVCTGTSSLEKFGQMMNVTLDISTLSGTFFLVGTHYTQGDVNPIGNHYDEGTMSRITCP